MHARLKPLKTIHKIVSFDRNTKWGITLCSLGGNCEVLREEVNCPICIRKLKNNRTINERKTTFSLTH